MVELKVFFGKGTAYVIDTVSAMRTRHFRDYPYLYDATFDPGYEKRYIQELTQNPHAMVVLAYADNKLIAISTSLPLVSDADILHGIESKFKQQGYSDLSQFYYWSEVVIESEFRGSPVIFHLHEFFEFQTVSLGYTHACCATVVRDENDPRKPIDYRDSDSLWRRLGYTRTNILFEYRWPTLMEDGSSRYVSNQMVMWINDKLKMSSGAPPSVKAPSPSKHRSTSG